MYPSNLYCILQKTPGNYRMSRDLIGAEDSQKLSPGFPHLSLKFSTYLFSMSALIPVDVIAPITNNILSCTLSETLRIRAGQKAELPRLQMGVSRFGMEANAVKQWFSSFLYCHRL